VRDLGIPVVVLLYLGIDAGGYDILVRSQLGIIAWWVVLLGLALGYLPTLRVTRAGWTMILVLLLLAAWTALGALTWTESTERGVIEVGRVLVLLGFFGLFLLIQGREGLRYATTALAVVVGVIAGLALLERFEPSLLPFLESGAIPENYPGARLRFPLEYWNGLAALLAIGLPAQLWVATGGLTRAGRAVASGTIPLVLLALYMTFSRGGVLEVLVAILVLLLFFPRRLHLIVVALVPFFGAAVLIWQLGLRQELLDFVPGALTASQGSQMLLISVAVAVGTGLVGWLLDWGVGSGLIPIPRIPARLTSAVGVLLATGAVGVLVVGAATGYFGERWNEFRQPAANPDVAERLGSISSSERYFLFDSAIAAGRSEPVRGIGPGTFEYWYAQEGEGSQFVRDAHSLYLEAFAELGLPGLILVLALVVGPIVIGVRLLLRHDSGQGRSLLASSLASMTAFAVAAAVDWAWEMTVLPVAFLLLVAAVAGPGTRVETVQEQGTGIQSISRAARISGVIFAALAIITVAIPMISTELVRSSQAEVRAGQLDSGLQKAERAVRVQPWSASALIQEASVLSLLGREDQAVRAARRAISKEPENWRNWFILASVLREVNPEEAEKAQSRVSELRARSTRGSRPQPVPDRSLDMDP